jgi:hypothetical protein
LVERSSSTFSSESLGELRSLSRATRLGILAYVLAGAVILCGGFAFLRRALPSWYWGNARTEVLFVGTSHVLDDIRPARMPWPTGRLWAAGADQSLLTTALLRHRAFWPALKVVVIEVDEMTLLSDRVWTERSDLSRITGGLDLDAWELPLRDRGRIPWLALNLIKGTGWSAMDSQRRLTVDNFWGVSLGSPAAWSPDRSPPPPLARTSTLSVALSLSGIAQLRKDTAPDTAYNVASLIELVRTLRAEGLAVILLSTPNHGYYRGVRPKEWANAVHDAVDRVRAEMKEELPYWDDRADPSFVDDDFNNATHLSEPGAARYTDMLAERLSAQGFMR